MATAVMAGCALIGGIEPVRYDDARGTSDDGAIPSGDDTTGTDRDDAIGTEGGADSGGIPPTPVDYCAGHSTALFCSDFTRAPAAEGWVLVESRPTTMIDLSTDAPPSPLHAARIASIGGGAAPVAIEWTPAKKGDSEGFILEVKVRLSGPGAFMTAQTGGNRPCSFTVTHALLGVGGTDSESHVLSAPIAFARWTTVRLSVKRISDVNSRVELANDETTVVSEGDGCTADLAMIRLGVLAGSNRTVDVDDVTVVSPPP